jgi:acyl-CoA synthetase (AMP-forming)/AMP-acid ligase II
VRYLSFDVRVRLSWGMTELSPCGVVGSLKRNMLDKSMEETKTVRLKPGRAMYGLDLTLRSRDDDDGGDDGDGKNKSDDKGNEVGALHVRGPWTIQRYWNHKKDAVDEEGWFDTVRNLKENNKIFFF